MSDEYKKIEGHDFIMCPCPFCGSSAELWERSKGEGVYQKVVMCSNGGNGLADDGCPMYMPPEGFYKATKLDALNAWNTRA